VLGAFQQHREAGRLLEHPDQALAFGPGTLFSQHLVGGLLGYTEDTSDPVVVIQERRVREAEPAQLPTAPGERERLVLEPLRLSGEHGRVDRPKSTPDLGP